MNAAFGAESSVFFCESFARFMIGHLRSDKNPFLTRDSLTPPRLDCVKTTSVYYRLPRSSNLGPKMNKLILSLAVFSTLMMSSVVFAQPPGGGRGGDGPQRGGRGMQRGGGGMGGGGQRPVSPLMTALDVDKDGKLSKEEIANAAKALAALDKNEDGVLDTEELAPSRGGRGGGRQGGGRPGGGGGDWDPSAIVDRIMARDTDKDGKLSKEEGGERMAGRFDEMDGDKDGFITRKEIEEAMKGWTGGGGRGGRGGGRGGDAPKSKDNRPAFDDK